MAKKLRTFHFNGRGNPQYSWDTWMDGQVWELESGVDFHVKMTSFRAAVASAAYRRGGKVRTQIKEGNLVIQFFEEEE